MNARIRTPLVLVVLLGLVLGGVASPQTVPAPSGNTLAEAARMTTRASELFDRGLFDQAEPLFRQALAIREAQLTPDKALPIALSLMNLARTLRAQGRASDALPLDQRAQTLREQLAGPDSVPAALASAATAYDRVALAQYAEAESAFRHALQIYDKTPPPQPAPLAEALDGLGNLYHQMGRFREAGPLFERAQSLYEQQFGADSRQAANVLTNRGTLASGEGRYGDGESLLKRALGIDESVLGTDHPAVARVLDALAVLYRQQNRDKDALPLLARSLAIRQKALGDQHPLVATTMGDLARKLRALHRLDEAEALLVKAVAIDQAANAPALGAMLEALGEVYRDEGHDDQAATSFERAIALRTQLLGEDNPVVAGALLNYALMREHQKRYGDAVDLFKRAVAIDDRIEGADHPIRAVAYGMLAEAERLQGQTASALRDSRTATEILSRHLTAESSAQAGDDASERSRYRGIFFQSIDLAYAQAAGSAATPVTDPAAIDPTFAVVQLTEASSAGQAVAGMAARFAAGTDALGAVVRQRQDLAERAQHVDAALTAAAAQPRAQRDVAAEAALRSNLDALHQQLAALDQRLTRDFPAYAELVSPQPLPLAAAQHLLGPDEAMLVYLTGANESWLWVVRPASVSLEHLDITAGALATEVRALRERLDPERNSTLQPFPATRANRLFAKIFAPAIPHLANAHDLIVVPDGALSSLPLDVLVTKPPPADPLTPADHRSVAWLARDYAVTVLPTVGSLRALRQFAASTHATAPFLGVGDPILAGGPGGERGVNATALFRGGVGNVDEIRKLPPLPETADELRAIAKTLGASDGDLYLRDRASEPTLRGTALDSFRVIEFATHALIAGDFPGLTEPSLVLTPPAVASPANDGLLTASKIATLKLNADWVVLSACNTAAGDGTPGAGGFSGLAKAFFYAGARSLLVSHWAVPSVATVKLTTGAFAALAKEPGIGRAEALRRAMVAMWDPGNPPEFAHPAAWAPFSLVGEGGARR